MTKDDIADLFYNNKPYQTEKPDNDFECEINPEQKHSIFDREKFEHGREVLGKIIVKGMRTSGGTDVDWLIEHRGSFVILELKKFSKDHIGVPWAQMKAYEELHANLNKNGKKCYIYFIGTDEIDFTRSNFPLWFFEMNEWKNKTLPHQQKKFETSKSSKNTYYFERDYMNFINLKDFQDKLESHWQEFEKP